MGNSNSQEEEDRSSAQRRSQIDQLAREEAFYRFVNNLSEEDYNLMRDNNLLATIGESTEEELMRRLQQIKEAPPQELGEGNSSENASSDDPTVGWITTFRQTENMTEREQGDNQSWTSTSSNNSSNSDFGCSGGMNFNLLNRSPDQETGHLTFVRLLEREYTENSQRQGENPLSESTETSSSGSKENATEAFMEVPPTRGQRRSRSRSPETRRTRPRIESSLSQNRQHEMVMILHYCTSLEIFECIQVNEPEIYARIQQNGALRGQITRPELQSQDLPSTSATGNAFAEDYSPNTTNDNESEGFRPRNPITLENRESEVENPPDSIVTRASISDGSATETFVEIPSTRGQRRSRSRNPETRRTRPRIESSSPPNRQHEMLMRFHYCTSTEINECIQINEREIYARIQQNGALRGQITRPELQRFRPRNPSTLFDDHPREFLLRDSIASRIQLIPETPNNTVTLENYQEEFRSRFSHSEQESMRSSVNTIRIPAPIANETTLWHMTEFDESSDLLDSDNQLEPSSLLLSQHMEKEESQNERDDSCDSIISSSNSDPSWDSRSSSPAISSSSSSYLSSSMIFEGNNEINVSSSSPSQPRQESQRTTPATSDKSDSWPFLAQFFILNEDHNQPTGLTKQQIDDLAVRNIEKDDTLKACSICLTEFRENNKIRILPCSHEYHILCIDRWLSEYSTCPVCRRELTDSDGRKNSS
ncbi:E3 ubiquitin-protein ligase RLIM-like [Marmota monax]|uniref:E3 ubiquitin-protein ligase RLIM-like n=1 Tax=Marmota monax TaxID=9995 RepID=UPI001EB09FEB|nr:E3 ubiquitin-protein ligase RLIM-like [Marmota monax]